MASVVYNNIRVSQDDRDCSICTENLPRGCIAAAHTGKGETHPNHLECISQWIIENGHNRCPNCRAEVNSYAGILRKGKIIKEIGQEIKTMAEEFKSSCRLSASISIYQILNQNGFISDNFLTIALSTQLLYTALMLPDNSTRYAFALGAIGTSIIAAQVGTVGLAGAASIIIGGAACCAATFSIARNFKRLFF